MRFVGRRLALAALLALSVVTFGLQSVVQAQETDDLVKIEIYKRFYDNAKTNPNAAYSSRARLPREIQQKTKTSMLTTYRSGSRSTSVTSASEICRA